MITETERGTGRPVTPGCLHPRWVASSHGESALIQTLTHTNLNLVWFHLVSVFMVKVEFECSQSRFGFIFPLCVWFSCRRFLLPEYLPYAGIFHERGQPGLATHSSVNRVLAGKHDETRSTILGSETSTSFLRFLCFTRQTLSSEEMRDVLFICSFSFVFKNLLCFLRGVNRGRTVCSRQQHRKHHLPSTVVGLHQIRPA